MQRISIETMENKSDKLTAIVIEDQCVIWDYIHNILSPYYEIKSFCNSSKLAEKAFIEFKPDLVWLDCYLGELCENHLGLKNSGLALAAWMKKHSPNTKIFLFTASYESSIIYKAESIGIEAVFLGAKFSNNKNGIVSIIERVKQGEKSIYVDSRKISETALKRVGKMTFFEFCVVASLLIGKSTAKIADELNSNRKQINNTLYRVKEKYDLSDDLSREEVLEELKEIILNSFEQLEQQHISEFHCLFKITDELLNPVVNQIRQGGLKGASFSSLLKN